MLPAGLVIFEEKHMKQVMLLLAFIGSAAILFAQKDMKTISPAGNKFSFSIPVIMDTMPADKILIKYNKKPDAKSWYYANTDYSFSIVMDEVAADITEDMLEPLKPQLLAQLGKQKFTENRIITVNGHQLIAVAFDSGVPGGKIFNRRIYFVAGSKLFSIAYNTTETDLQTRKTQINNSISSLRIK